MSRNGFIHLLALLIIGILVAIVAVSYSLLKPKSSSKPETAQLTQSPSFGQTKVTGEFDVVIKENATSELKSDIYLKDKKTGEEQFYVTLDEVYRGHYHSAEYHNGNLYIIHRTGGDYGYQNNPDWTDELWRYDQQKETVKLYSNRGLDFRVSDDEKFIAIIGSGPNNVVGENLAFLDNRGVVLKIFALSEVGTADFSPLMWSKNVFWVSGGLGPSIDDIVKINTDTFKFTKFDVSNFPIVAGEFDLNPVVEKIVFSDHPVLFDVESSEDFAASKAIVSLFVYDLADKKKQLVSTSITKSFDPKWIDENTIEYNNPDGEGRISKSFQ